MIPKRDSGFTGLIKAHAYDPSPYDEKCTCGMSRNYRAHQPLWWRIMFWGKIWRIL